MQHEYEITHYEKIRHISIFAGKVGGGTSHAHSALELLYVLDGEGEVRSAGGSFALSRGSAALLRAFEPHGIISRGAAPTLLIFHISADFLAEYCPGLKGAMPEQVLLDGKLSARDSEALDGHIRGAALAYFGRKSFFELECVAHVALLLSVILGVCGGASGAGKYPKREKHDLRMAAVLEYVGSNYQTQLRLTQAAELAGVTPTHLSHLFCEYTGESFRRYVARLRFEHSLRLLASTDLSLSQVAEESGFSQLKYMTRAYENMLGTDPKTFRSTGAAPGLKPPCGEPFHALTPEECLRLLR